jgi:hypothetical protein
MHQPLIALADIRVGHSFRTGIEDDPHGDIRVLQIRDIRGEGGIAFDSLPRVTWPASGRPPLLKPGDIMLPARGEHYDATLIRGNDRAIASGHVYIVHPKQEALSPEYLCWYLNRQAAQSYILRNRAGSSMSTLSRQVLEALPVPVPAAATQRKIVELAHLWQQEQSLTRELQSNRRQMLDGIFNKLLES